VSITRKWTAEEPEAILDYLHGDVPRDDVKPCCYYEYARASEVFQSARQEYDPDYADDPLNWIIDKFPLFCNDWRRLGILICPGYPELPWRDLTEAQRKNIAENFAKTRAPSQIRIMTQSFLLNKKGVFDRFKVQAESDAGEWMKDRSQYFPAIVGDNAIKYVVLPLDYAQGKDAVQKAFSTWLRTDANKKLFEKYYKKPIHKGNLDSPDRYKELLKYLAAWRLYDELGPKGAKDWTWNNRRQKKDALRLKPFFREKPIKKINVSPLYKDRKQWGHAIKKAKSFLAAEIELISGIT
jgi:hypothetical protein